MPVIGRHKASQNADSSATHNLEVVGSSPTWSTRNSLKVMLETFFFCPLPAPWCDDREIPNHKSGKSLCSYPKNVVSLQRENKEFADRKTNKTHTVMKRTILAASLLTLLLTSCATYTGQGAFIGANIGGLLGSAIGGSAAGWRGSDMGTLVGMAGGAAVGAAIGQAADRREAARYDYDRYYGEY